jgi:pimeloyl-ACP methyl ester carboxylesterase
VAPFAWNEKTRRAQRAGGLGRTLACRGRGHHSDLLTAQPTLQKHPLLGEYASLVTDRKHRLDGFEERELEWRGTRLRYVVGGAGPPLVLVHGLGGTIENWRALAPALAVDHRVVVPDLPGHGHSELLPEARDVDALAEAALGILDAEDAGDAVWVGHSLGGVVALRAAVLRPDAARGVVLAAAAGIGTGGRAAQITLALLGITKPGRLIAPHRRAWAVSRLGRRAAFGWWGVADPDALEPELAEALLVGPAHHMDTRQAGRALLASDPRMELDRVACACLCLWGASDNWVKLDDGMEYARRLRAPLRTIAGCGHLLICERPDACLAAIRDFVASLANRPTAGDSKFADKVPRRWGSSRD